jgi:hypothetical protein
VRKIPDRTRFVARVYRRDEKDLFLPLAVVAATALQLLLVSVAGASATQLIRGPRTMSQNFANQSAMRAAQPITRGGTVNPGLTGDHMQRGNNG